MDIRHLSVFTAVAHDLSFTRAAERLMLAQSAVSTTVRELERELGVLLFDRSHRQIRLTPAGDEMLARSLDVIDRMRQIGEVVGVSGGGVRGTVTMGLMTAVTLIDVPGLLGRFHAEHPDVTLQLRAARLGSSGLITQLERGDIDLALLSVVDGLPATLHGEIVASSPFVLVVPDGHRLAGRASVELADLDGERFIDVPQGYGSRRIIDEAFARSGTSRRVLVEVAEIGTAAEYVPHGLGIALVPEFAAAEATSRAAGARVVRLAQPIPPFEVWLAVARRRPLLRATASLMAVLRRELVPAR